MAHIKFWRLFLLLLAAGSISYPASSLAADWETAYYFDDEANHERTPHPAWFKKSFYDLNEDIQEAKQQGKQGLMLFFGTEQCSYCKMFIQKTLADVAIQKQLRANFDVIGIDIFSDVDITDIDGKAYTASQFVYHKKAYFSPTLIFYDTNGGEILKIVGYYPPNKFKKVLSYLVNQDYKRMRLGEYLASSEINNAKDFQAIPKDKLFSDTRTDFRRTAIRSARPLLLLLERSNCEACIRFHNNILSDPAVRKRLIDFELAQIDIGDRTSTITTPDGQNISPYEWSKQLKLQYAPALLFYDGKGKLILRHESDMQAFRVKRMLKHAINKVYLTEKQFNRWYADELRRENKTYKISQ